MQSDKTNLSPRESDRSNREEIDREENSPVTTQEATQAPTKLSPGVPSVWPPVHQDYRRRSRLPKVVIGLLLSLALILIVGGMGIITYSTTVQYGGVVRTVSTTVAVSTKRAVSVVQAHQQATVQALNTVQAGINATATAVGNQGVVATSTVVSATATASVLSDLYTKSTNGTPTFNDPLSSNASTSRWTEGSAANTAGCVFQNGAYHARETQQGYLQPCIAEATQFKNFAYQVQVSITQGNEGRAGLIFHVDSADHAYYFFHIGTDGSYTLDVYKSINQVSTLATGISTAISTSPGQSNQLTVIAQNTTYTLYVNSQPIMAVSDGTLSTGKIGVAVIDVNTPVDAAFSNAQVWQL